MSLKPGDIVGTGMTLAVLVFVVLGVGGRPPGPETTMPTRLGAAGGLTTSREDIDRAISEAEARLSAGDDREAALLLADALIRQARVSGRATLTQRAVETVERIVRRDPQDYEARRLLATAYAADHRFRDALREADRARALQPEDPWNYGIIGDAHVELGEYEQGFAAFQQMVTLKPSAAAYSRLSYGFELQGRLDEAIDAMTLAVDAADPRDGEAAAWLHAHLGELYVQMGRLADARREYAWAERMFREHPFVRMAIARLMEVEGDLPGALAIYREELAKLNTAELSAAIGDIHEQLGNREEAERFHDLAEAQWRNAAGSEADHFARFLADHDRHIDEAVRLAEAGTADATDIAAKDALAWVYYKAGRLADADRESRLALRTGTRNAGIRYHAAVIRQAMGDTEGARQILRHVPPGRPAPARLARAIETLKAHLDPAVGSTRHSGG